MIFDREIEKRLESKLFKGKVIIIYGPRQSGKTTLAKKILKNYGDEGIFLNCELISDRSFLVAGDPELLLQRIGNKKIVVLDEAQSVNNIGLILKNFVDTYPEIQLIATGSSSFDLANEINEPLTGRSYEFTLYPLSFAEAQSAFSDYSVDSALSFGMYPGVIGSNNDDKEDILRNIASNYLYKDIFSFEHIKKPIVFENLVSYLAYNTGAIISPNEIATSLGTNRATVERYIALLEQAFIIKRIYSFARNLSNELKKSYKVYFLDIGLVNIITERNIHTIDDRSMGALFENFFIIERIKKASNKGLGGTFHFWRTYDREEVDVVELLQGEMNAFECKYKKTTPNSSFYNFKKYYPESTLYLVNKDNAGDLLL